MIIPALLLLCLGITVIYTSNSGLALQQLFFSLIGLVGFFFLSNFDFRALKPAIKLFYITTCLLLIVVFVLGFETRGSLRWIPLGFFNFQPSELAKISLILSLAYFWEKRLASWRNLMLSLLILAPPILLVFNQPDLGTALTLGFIWFGMLFAANISWVKLAVLAVLGILGTPFSWLFLKEYQKVRFLSFLNPNQDPLGVGYNVIQSTIAVGSGQLFGRGLGRGTQSRLQFLPEFRTDFIFAFIAEELGFLGGLIVLVLYSVFFWLLFRLLSRVEDRFAELIIIGALSMFSFQVVVNIGMNIGIMPITGITLPFLSYGGSSVITSLIAVGLAASIGRFGSKKQSIDTFSLH